MAGGDRIRVCAPSRARAHAGRPRLLLRVPSRACGPRPRDEPAQAHYGLVVKPIPKPLNTALRGIEPLQVVRAIRPTIGRDVSVWMFRSGYFMALVQSLGKEYLPWSMLAGRKLGKLFEKVTTPEQMKQLFEAMRIGKLELDLTPGDASAEVTESVLCANMMGVEEPCCSFVAGTHRCHGDPHHRQGMRGARDVLRSRQVDDLQVLPSSSRESADPGHGWDRSEPGCAGIPRASGSLAFGRLPPREGGRPGVGRAPRGMAGALGEGGGPEGGPRKSVKPPLAKRNLGAPD